MTLRRTIKPCWIYSTITFVIALLLVLNIRALTTYISSFLGDQDQDNNLPKNPSSEQYPTPPLNLHTPTSQNPPKILNPNLPQIRHLEQNNFWDPNSTKSSIYMILLIIGLSILVLGSIAFCIIFVVRYFRNSNHIHQIKNSNQTFSQLDTDIIFPQLDFPLFYKQIGKPMHQHCVICLETFQPQTPFTQQPSQQQQKSQNKVCLTVCGHLLHFKCLAKWIERQPNCPLCREQFTDENISVWQNKIHIDFSYIYKLLDLQNRSLRWNILSKSRENQQIFKQQKICNNISQPQWLKLYNTRQIINKQRHQKYNLNKLLHSQPKQKQVNRNYNKVQISPILNDSTYTPQNMGISYITHPILSESLNTNSNTQILPINPNKRKELNKTNQKIATKFRAYSKFQPNNFIQTNLQLINIATSTVPTARATITKQQLYALAIYSAIMDYHDWRMNGGVVRLELEEQEQENADL